MDNQTHEKILEVLESVLEQFAFMFYELIPKEELPQPESNIIQATLAFSGPHHGELSITSTNDLCRIISGNLIGLEPDDEGIDDYSKDSLSELINVLIGHLLTALYGKNILFDFGTPDVRDLDQAEWDELFDNPSTIGILIEDIPALLQYQIDS